MPGSLRERRLLVGDMEPLRPPPGGVVRRAMSIHSALRHDLKQNITEPTTLVRLPVVLTLKK
jgi:hypothetical protein